MTARRDRGRARATLGIDRVVWLADGIAEDAETDGHVDNVVAFVAAGPVPSSRAADDPDNPNHAIAPTTARRLEAAGIEVVEVPALPYADVGGVHTSRCPT